LQNGRRLLVSTHTRALQEQILERDLPIAAAALARLGFNLRYAMLQGSDNYLCMQRLSKLVSQPELFSSSAASTLAEIQGWSVTAKSGHRSALPMLVPQTLWGKLSRDPDLCPIPQGRFRDSCLYRKDRERAEAAQVLVVNHALLLSGGRLPPFDALVIDEAHSLEEAAVSHFGFSISQGRLIRLVEEARELSAVLPELGKVAAQFIKESSEFFRGAAAACGLEGQSEESAVPILSDTELGKEPKTWRQLAELCASALEKDNLGEFEPELRLLQSRLASLRADFSVLSSCEDSEGLARWIEKSPTGVVLRAAPLDVAEKLSKDLFSRPVPVILSSATLAGPGGLAEFRAHIGLGSTSELILDSPFDYEKQAALLLVSGLPAPDAGRRYVSELSRSCHDIIKRVPGGIFLLFSSWKVLRQVHRRLKRLVKSRPIWMQGEAGHEELINEFSAAKNAVLLGVDTFWQGVDVPDSALSCVVLTKLPFPSVGSPVEAARKRWYQEQGRDYFSGYSLPRAVMRFRQGFGRLIRSSRDRGAVVVLDSRVLERGYGPAFIDALPRCRRLESIEDLETFFAQSPRAQI
jgi:ATP-dependent DNA helicase DinG